MNIYNLKSSEKALISDLIVKIKMKYTRADCKDFLNDAFIHSLEIPTSIRRSIKEINNIREHSGCVLLRGLDVDSNLPATPVSWYPEDSYDPDLNIDFISILMTSMLGDAFGFDCQQGGKLIHDIVPIKGKEYFQAGCSSLGELSFHTEDAFHPHRGEYLCFYCLKNPTETGTLGASVDSLSIPENVKSILSQNRFFTRPDNAHSVDVESVSEHPILFGNIDSPFIRFDPDFTFAKKGDEEAIEALEYIINEINSKLDTIPLEPGDICILDNFRWVHGRRPFVANYDGNDRWLRRLNITTDLKKSANYRRDIRSRILSAEPVVESVI